MENYKNSKIGQETAQKYGDIIEMERPQTEESLRKHPRMTLQNRAKIFSPFAALRGYDEQLAAEKQRTERVPKRILTEEEMSALSDRLMQVTKGMTITVLDVAPEFMDFLKDYYAQWKAQKKLMGASWQKNLEKKGSKYAQSLLDLRGNDFVICNDYGFPINPDSYGALVRRVGKKAGIEKIHPHMFRHTFVSILLSNPNIGVATVAAEAGHAQPSTTLAIYTQVYDRRRDEIRKQMSRELYK